MDSSQIGKRAWSYAGVLQDAGLSCFEYVEQLTLLLFLKMADQLTEEPYGREPIVPQELGWKSLLPLDGAALEDHYRRCLERLGLRTGMLGVIFKGARCEINNPALLCVSIGGATGKLDLTIEGYTRFFSDFLYTELFLKSLAYAAITTVICLLIAYPLALLIARSPKRHRDFLVLLVILPFWSNFLIRVYAWMIVLGPQAALARTVNGFLDWFGAGPVPLQAVGFHHGVGCSKFGPTVQAESTATSACRFMARISRASSAPSLASLPGASASHEYMGLAGLRTPWVAM